MMSQWHSIHDRLPELGETVLGWSTLNDDGFVLARLTLSGKWRCVSMWHGEYETAQGISHWTEVISPVFLIGHALKQIDDREELI